MTEAALHTIAMTLTEWDFTVKGGGAGQPVRLPHDAMIHEHRDPRAPGGADTAYFPVVRTATAPTGTHLRTAHRRSLCASKGSRATRP